jgi:membrane associated rhomboid family serine protease
MLPLADDNPRNTTPVVTWGIIGICIAVFLWQLSLGSAGDVAYYGYGLVPARLTGVAELPAGIPSVPAWATVLTSMFMHGGFVHIGGNMLYLWIFGDNVEDSMGHVRFAVFYLVCGIIAALTQTYIAPASQVPVIGASGAIAGVLGAYILLHPRATVRTLIFLGIIFWIVRIPAVYVLGFWFLLQFLNAAGSTAGNGGVAVWAHVGGFIAGLILVMAFRRRGVDVWQGARSRAFHVEPRRGPWG